METLLTSSSKSSAMV